MNTIEQTLKYDCFYAAALGDALGVPHEFKSKWNVNEDYIMHPELIPKSYKTYKVKTGLISDDFSQILMVEDCLQELGSIEQGLSEWIDGKYWTDGILFDIGMQTRAAIYHLKNTGEILVMPESSGNGGLMRTLPVAFLDFETIAYNARYISSFTHNSNECLIAVEFYSKLVHFAWKARAMEDHKSIKNLLMNKGTFDYIWNDVEYDMKVSIRPSENERGVGYVMDSLKLVYKHIMESESFVDCLTRSIKFGGDTDTNTSIVAPVAAMVFGMGNIPQEWHDMMKVNETNPFYMKYCYGENNGTT